MERLRSVWKNLFFPDVPSSRKEPSSSSPSSSLSLSWQQRRCMPLHRCLELASSAPSAKHVNPGAYRVSRTRGPVQYRRVKIPEHVTPGTEFPIVHKSRQVMVQCPATARPGGHGTVRLPSQVVTRQALLTMAPLTRNNNPVAPARARIGTSSLVAKSRTTGTLRNDGIKRRSKDDLGRGHKVTFPDQAKVGDTVLFRLSSQTQPSDDIQLNYPSVAHGWYRFVCDNDLKFQWVYHKPTEQNGNTTCHDLDMKEIACCCKLTRQPGKDDRMPTGSLEFVGANDAMVDSHLKVDDRASTTSRGNSNQNKVTLFMYHDIASVQSQSLEDKVDWFHSNVCTKLAGSWENGYLKLVIRRDHLLQDSIKAVLSLGREDLRNHWRMEFVREPGVDSGGLAREWFHLVTEQIMDPDLGLWERNSSNQMCVAINPASESECPGNHLLYYRFFGRVLGRGLFDCHLVKCRFVQFIYKYLLGSPITIQDLAAHDDAYYQSILKLIKMEEDEIASLCLDFSVTEVKGGKHVTVELAPGGAHIEVTKDNMTEYLDGLLHYRILGRTKSQMTELMLGFYDVIPVEALTVFDSRELELVLCGLPTINIDDWFAHSRYSGTFKDVGVDDEEVKWFWEIVAAFDQEKRSRLLQFVTGTSGVPSQGFSALQGVDGNIKLFAIHGTDCGPDSYPRARTCFNRIDLPKYKTKAHLREKLNTAIAFSFVGFGID